MKKQGKHWNAKCESASAADESRCPFHMLATQPDFLETNTMLHQAITDAGHLFSLYPKYHCETNWIERYWRAAKRITRKECDYSYKALRDNLDKASSPDTALVEICRYYSRCWRYIAVYSQGTGAEEAFSIVMKFTSKRFRSHCRIGNED
jgi:hypothetical protein